MEGASGFLIVKEIVNFWSSMGPEEGVWRVSRFFMNDTELQCGEELGVFVVVT